MALMPPAQHLGRGSRDLGVSSSPQVAGKVQAFLVPSLLSDPRVLAGKAGVTGLMLQDWGWGQAREGLAHRPHPPWSWAGTMVRWLVLSRGLTPRAFMV